MQTLLGLLMLIVLPSDEAELTSYLVPPLGYEKAQDGEEEDEEGEEGEGSDEEEGFGGWGEDGEDGLDLDDIMKSLKADAAAGDKEAAALQASLDGPTKRPAVTQLWAHRRALSEAWVACLKLDLSPSLYRAASAFVAKHVIDVMVNPLQVGHQLASNSTTHRE